MRGISCLFLILFAIAGRVSAQNDFPARKGATEGRLTNGIKYYTMSTPWIKGKFAIGMVVKTGSLYEAKEDVGVAHFLEHLVSTSVPGFDRRKSLDIVYNGGMNLFDDWQAFTSEIRTIYNYTYPKENKDTEQQLITYLRGVLGKMEFTQKEVDIERPAILAETKTSFSSGGMSNLRGGYFEKHTILGDSVQISLITPEKLKKFYRKWYRPENIAFVMIGDASAADLEKKLKAAFDDAKCVVDSISPPAFLPLNQNNVSLYSPSEIEKDKRKGYSGRLIYRFPLCDLTKRTELRKAIAMEMTTNIFKGMLEGTKSGIEVSSAIPSNMPRSSVLNVKMTFTDSVAFQHKLKEIGNAISHLRYGEVSKDFINKLWQKHPSIYKIKVRISDSFNTSTLLSSIYGNFMGGFPLADPDVFANALDQAATQVTSEDIRKAAEVIFTQSRSFLAGLPDYGPSFEKRMVVLFDGFCSQPNSRVKFDLPVVRNRIAPKYSDSQKLISEKKPIYKPGMVVEKKLLNNGMHSYRLKNGIELIWENTDRRKHILVETATGTATVVPDERSFLDLFKEIRRPGLMNVTNVKMEELNRSWGSPTTTIKMGSHKISIETEWAAKNEEFIWQYIAQIYTGVRLDDSHYKKATISNQKNKAISLSKEEVEDRINRMLVPAQTRVFLQGKANIDQVIAYLNEMPAKNILKFENEEVNILSESKLNKAEEMKGRTYLVNRMTKEPVNAITLKRYVIHGMLEEYMSRMLLLQIRNEKGLIYTWGTTSSYSLYPSPNVSLSLRFRVIPEFLDTALIEFSKLCIQVAKDGIDDHKLIGLKRREWSRYVDFYNNPEEVMPFISNQLSWTGHIWSDDELRKTIAGVSLTEVNDYFKHYLSLPSEIKTY